MNSTICPSLSPLVWNQEQKVDIGKAPTLPGYAAGGGDAEVLALGGIGDGIDLGDGEVVKRPNNLIDQEGERPRRFGARGLSGSEAARTTFRPFRKAFLRHFTTSGLIPSE